MKTTNLLFVLLGVFILSACNHENAPEVLAPTSFELNKASLSLVAGGREKLLIIVTPTAATLSNPKWSSSVQSVATVDENGVVSALTTGNAIITLTVGDKSKQCSLEVVKSPITELIMPDVKYPIAVGATIMLQGTGFTAGDKIWFRKNDNSPASVKSPDINATPMKSVHSSGDILATIHEQALNYILFSSSINDGWYSVILDKDNTQYNLGNIQIVTAVIPEFVYDKTKIFWEDTHWRRFLLRGKVKEMTITKKYRGPYDKVVTTTIMKYNFNQTGHFESYKEIFDFNGESAADSTIFKYDDKNRLTSIYWYRLYPGDRSLLTLEFTYGNHELYLPMMEVSYCNSIGFAFNNYWSNNDYLDDNEIWLKGLTGIKKSLFHSNSTTPSNGWSTQIEVSSNSITTKMFSENTYKVKDVFTYNGAFPLKQDHWDPDPGNIASSPDHTTTFQFSSIGIPIKTVSSSGGYETNYCENTPYYLVSNYSYSGSSILIENYKDVYEYDKNWNLTKETWGSNSQPAFLCNYVSYDVIGNWTQCNEKTGAIGDLWSLCTITRDITYW